MSVSGYDYASHIVDMGETFTGDLIELNQGAMACERGLKKTEKPFSFVPNGARVS